MAKEENTQNHKKHIPTINNTTAGRIRIERPRLNSHNLPIAKNSNSPSASDFSFAYTDILGGIHDYKIQQSPSDNGTMIIFPAGVLADSELITRLIVLIICISIFIFTKKNLVLPTIFSALFLSFLTNL